MDQQLRGQTFKHLLVPLWLVSYTYGGPRVFQVLVRLHRIDCRHPALERDE
ncbi:MAG TPA: hypothetical protein VN851_07000 [Thermoanaerobaculia bacterium]|nr:hypothetical protein [Thermoanaerobaculia bacterium]